MESYDNPDTSNVTHTMDTTDKKLTDYEKDMGLVEIDLPVRIQNVKVLETIHSIFKTIERIDDKIIFKYDNGLKADVHHALQNSIQQQKQDWWVRKKVTCVINSNEYLPDVGGWNNRPSHAQRTYSIRHMLPPPELWIETIYNNIGQHEKVLAKINSIKSNLPGIEFVLIALETTDIPHHLNPNPGIQSMVATPINDLPGEETYVGHWKTGVEFNNMQWYKVKWNNHIILGCEVSLYFNDILDQIAS